MPKIFIGTLEKYKHRAIDILKFGIKHNTEIINKVGADTYCICNELGGVIDFGRTDWFSCDVDNIAVYVDMEVNDEVNDDEIKALIKQLPKFKKDTKKRRNKYVSFSICIEK